MMLPTHALAGMVLALPVAAVAPELSGVALAAGFVGGAFPDLDMYAGHRKTLHYPTYYTVLAAVAVVVAVAAPVAATVAVAVGLLAAALHSVADAFGGGLELRPWEATSSRAVFDHHRGEWIPPLRWVPYDGSPADFALAVVLAAPLLAVINGPLSAVVWGAVAVGGGYAAVRRLLPDLAELVVGSVLLRALPDGAVERLPRRYREVAAD